MRQTSISLPCENLYKYTVTSADIQKFVDAKCTALCQNSTAFAYPKVLVSRKSKGTSKIIYSTIVLLIGGDGIDNSIYESNKILQNFKNFDRTVKFDNAIYNAFVSSKTGYSYSQIDIDDFINHPNKYSDMEISPQVIDYISANSKPHIEIINGERYGVLLAEPKLVIADMLIDPTNPTDDFDITITKIDELSENNLQYTVILSKGVDTADKTAEYDKIAKFIR